MGNRRQLDWRQSVSQLLDQTVLHSYRVSMSKLGWHPYFVCTNLGLFSALCSIYLISYYVKQAHPLVHVLVLLMVYLSYEVVFLRVKRMLLRSSSRSYLQDALLFLIPVYFLAYHLLHIPWHVASDIMGLVFPAILMWVRLGCFLGGCCYGIHCSFGVCYPASMRQPYQACGRRFLPGPSDGRRVFPLQLLEALFHASCLVFLSVAMTFHGRIPGSSLILYFLAYSVFRFFSDFVRNQSARPRYGTFSEAQVFSLVILVISSCALKYASMQR